MSALLWPRTSLGSGHRITLLAVAVLYHFLLPLFFQAIALNISRFPQFSFLLAILMARFLVPTILIALSLSVALLVLIFLFPVMFLLVPTFLCCPTQHPLVLSESAPPHLDMALLHMLAVMALLLQIMLVHPTFSTFILALLYHPLLLPTIQRFLVIPVLAIIFLLELIHFLFILVVRLPRLLYMIDRLATSLSLCPAAAMSTSMRPSPPSLSAHAASLQPGRLCSPSESASAQSGSSQRAGSS